MVAAVSNVEPLLMTVWEAAQALALAERTLWSLPREGEFQPVRTGRSVRYSAEDCREFRDGLGPGS